MHVVITPAMVGQIVISGLLAGALYAMVALGLALVFGVMRVINVAHGTLLMLGAYTTFWWFHLLGLNPYLSLLASMPLMFAFGMLLQRLLVRRVVDAPELSSLLLTFGISIALVNLTQLAFTSDLRSVEFLTGAFIVGPFALSKSRLIAFAFAVGITLFAFWFLQKTKFGKAIRATSQSREVAMVCGINAPRIHLYTFGIASALEQVGTPEARHGIFAVVAKELIVSVGAGILRFQGVAEHVVGATAAQEQVVVLLGVHEVRLVSADELVGLVGALAVFCKLMHVTFCYTPRMHLVPVSHSFATARSGGIFRIVNLNFRENIFHALG
jgi:ABC-type uncharacterized transport system permease subunit